jgi:hypothetical protein
VYQAVPVAVELLGRLLVDLRLSRFETDLHKGNFEWRDHPVCEGFVISDGVTDTAEIGIEETL